MILLNLFFPNISFLTPPQPENITTPKVFLYFQGGGEGGWGSQKRRNVKNMVNVC